jgi:uncharacterized repeat protein (TIGR03803 family)
MKKLLFILGPLLYASFPTHGQSSLYGLNFKGNGSVIEYNLATKSLKAVYTLNELDGEGPYSSLIQGFNGSLYGMTAYSGTYNNGTIFSFNPSTAKFTKVYDFDGVNGGRPSGNLLAASNKKLYGLSLIDGSGNIFSFDPVLNTYSKLHVLDPIDGDGLFGSLIEASNGKMYGLAYKGGSGGTGASGFGTIFSFDPSTNKFQKVFDFNGSTGANPYGTLVEASDKKLYGTTSKGGDHNLGVVFSYDPVTNTFAKLHDFDGTNGATPFSNLMQASNGLLYGTTEHGSLGAGSVFSFNLSTLLLVNLHNFNVADGADPSSTLIQASDGLLYGMTETGGSTNEGTVFSFNPVNSTFKHLQDFNGENGAFPHFGSLIEVRKSASSGAITIKNLTLITYPNPSPTGFVLTVRSSVLNETVQLKILNASGNVVEIKRINVNSIVRFGNSYSSGPYFVEATQGNQKASVKLIKQ